MGKSELSRREVLSGLAVAGSSGALVSGGVVARLSDKEEFRNNSLSAGIVDLRVDWSLAGGESGSSEGPTSIPIVITEDETSGEAALNVSVKEGSNPVYAWVGTQCPEPPSNIVDDLMVTLRYADGPLIEKGSLHSVAEALQNGIGLDSERGATERHCVSSGETIDLVFEWSLPRTYNGDDATTITFEFVGRQCRHNDGMTSPFPSDQRECELPENSTRKPINHIAFCIDGDVSDLSRESTAYIDDVTSNSEGEPIALEWSLPHPVKYVVVKGGNPTDEAFKTGGYMTIYDYRGEDKTTGTAFYLDEDAAVPMYDIGTGDMAVPCAIAEKALTGDGGDEKNWTQLNIEYGDGAGGS